MKDIWASGEAYDRYVGRWSRLVAVQFLDWLAVPALGTWLDVGCGTGALSQTILNTQEPAAIKGVDSAQGFIEHTRRTLVDERITFELGDALSLPVENAQYDAVVSGFALNFFPDPLKAVREIARALKPAGTAGAYVWDYAGRMQFMRIFWNAAIELDPAAAKLDEGKRFSICDPDSLSHLFLGAGMTQVVVHPIDIWTVFADFDDYWNPFLGGQGSAPTYLMSKSEVERDRLRERIQKSLPYAVDGSIPLMARAWAVQGRLA